MVGVLGKSQKKALCTAFAPSDAINPLAVEICDGVDNHWDGNTSEGCGPTNHGLYGTANCGMMVRNGVKASENGNNEDCAGNIQNCVTGSCSEGVTWHAIVCQCQ